MIWPINAWRFFHILCSGLVRDSYHWGAGSMHRLQEWWVKRLCINFFSLIACRWISTTFLTSSIFFLVQDGNWDLWESDEEEDDEWKEEHHFFLVCLCHSFIHSHSFHHSLVSSRSSILFSLSHVHPFTRSLDVCKMYECFQSFVPSHSLSLFHLVMRILFLSFCLVMWTKELSFCYHESNLMQIT